MLFLDRRETQTETFSEIVDKPSYSLKTSYKFIQFWATELVC